MPAEIISYREWEFEVDLFQTLAFYQSKIGEAEDCGCEACKEYLAVRDGLYPAEIKTLFNKLGVNISKEDEVYSYKNGIEHVYDGWFYFIGKIIKGKDGATGMKTGGYMIDLTAINKFFSISFTEKVTFSQNLKDLIQIDFSARLPGRSN